MNNEYDYYAYDYYIDSDSSKVVNRDDTDVRPDNWWVRGEPIWSLAAKHDR